MDPRPLIIVMLAFVCYYNSLKCDLVFDDVPAIKDNRDLRPYAPLSNVFYNDFWGTPLTKEQSHKSYRPICVLSFRLNYYLHQLEPFGYHLVNVLLHAIVCWIYYRICLLFVSSTTSFVASVLFAVQPIHTEAVTSVVGRAELLSSVFYLSVLYLHVRRSRRFNGRVHWPSYCAVSALSTLGMLCKEQSVTALVVCCVYELTSLKISEIEHCFGVASLGSKVTSTVRIFLHRVAILFAAGFCIVSSRILLMGSHLPRFNRFDNPASVSASPQRQLTYVYLPTINFGLMLNPSKLCCDWSMGTVPLVSSLLDLRNLAAVILYLGLFLLLLSCFKENRIRQHVLMAVAMTVIPFVPASNLFFPVGFVVAERVLYVPSMGFCLLIAVGWSQLQIYQRYKIYLNTCLGLLVLIFAVRTIRRNEDWRTDYTLYDSALKVNEVNAKLYNNMGRVLEANRKFPEAVHHYKSAIRLEANDVRGYLNLGRVYAEMGEYQRAEDVFLEAKTLFPVQEPFDSHEIAVTKSHLQIFFHLASLISHNESRLEEADHLYQQVIDMKSDFYDAYLNRGKVLLKMNRTKEAEEMYEKALQLDVNNPDAYSNLGVVLMDRGRNKEALEMFNKALSIQPDHEKALMNSALLLRETGLDRERHLATERLQRILLQGKDSEEVYFNLGMLSLSKRDHRNAEKWFKKAIMKQPTMESALYNIALLLSNEHRHTECLSYVRQLLEYHPNHINGLILLADVYINSLNDLDSAEECYVKVLEQEPNNLQGLHNLCVVYLQRTQYKKAADCFHHVERIHPKVDYVKRHAEITEELLRRETLASR